MKNRQDSFEYSSVKQLINAHQKNTTTHGVPNLARAKGPIKRGLWILILSFTFAGLLFNVTQLTRKYLEFSKSISMNTISSSEMVFPSVTLCNMSPVRKSALDSASSSPIKNELNESASDESDGNRMKRSLSGCQTQTIFTASQGFISSPNYPNSYPISIYCFYIISLAEPSCITITFNETFWVEATSDYVQINTYPPISPGSSPSEFYSYDGSTSPGSLVIAHCSTVWIDFCSDYIGVGAGFGLSYSSDNSTAACNTKTTCTTQLTTTYTPNASSTTSVPGISTFSSDDIFFQTTFSSKSQPADPVHCCCKCCSDTNTTMSTQCQYCSNASLNMAADCASHAPDSSESKNLPSRNAEIPNLIEPSPLNGSTFPGRLAYSPNFLENEIFTEQLAEMSVQQKTGLGFQINDMLLDCQFEGQPCNVSRDFVQYYNADYGNCFVFNSGWNKNIALYKSTKPGSRNGLQMIVNINQSNYASQAGDIAGLRVIVLSQNQIAFPENEGITVSPGYFTSIGLRPETTDRLSRPFSDCIPIEERDIGRNVYSEIYPVEYRVKACENTCYQRNVIQECHCFDSHFPSYGQALGNVKVSVCSSSNVTQDDCVYSVSQKFINRQIVCDCPQRCKDVLFEPTVTFIRWPSQSTRDKLRSKLGGSFTTFDERMIKENLLELNLFFSSFQYRNISEFEGYEMLNFFSDMCGVIGLWFGFAMMTFTEYFELVFDIVVVTFGKIRKR